MSPRKIEAMMDPESLDSQMVQNQMSRLRLRAGAVLPLYSVEGVTKSKPGKRIMTERDQLSYACSYSCLVSFVIIYEFVTRDSNRSFASCPQSRFQSESNCEVLVFLWSLVLHSRRMKTDIHSKEFLHRLALKVRL